MQNIIEEIIFNFSNNKSLYIGENVTIANHMLQTAMLAEKNKSSENLICASLLHDYGHFLVEDPDKLVDEKIDGGHESVGANYLGKFFPENIIEPILLHVEAKRFLARDLYYFKLLSEASIISLKLQGGPMSDDEIKRFKSKPYYQEAIKLRRFDEGAKNPKLRSKKISEYKELLISKLI
jgi:predicted HD phosphohydrolase